MQFIYEAFDQLYPNRDSNNYSFSMNYTGRFKAYNANVKYKGRDFTFYFSKNWRGVSHDIQMGLCQELFSKIWKTKKTTTNMDLYSLFLKNVHISIPKTLSDPVLKSSYDRNNEKFLGDLLEVPNLKWGRYSTTKLGCYEYGSDTISISQIFRFSDPILLDYVMYHEMLHKKFKFDCVNGRSHHHTPTFKKEEAKFPNYQKLELEISNLARKHIRQFSSIKKEESMIKKSKGIRKLLSFFE